jgi:hydrophobic/amphiphilic exporter-1 (mainly G- bacteria), HAE1 family
VNISAIAIRRPVFTVMVTVAILVLGLMGFRRLGSDLYPDVTFPAVVVTVPYPGASPAEVENLVIKPIEDAVVSLNGIDRVRGIARDSSGLIFVLFNLGVDLSESANEVRERISQVRYKLPPETKEPIIQRFDVSASPVITYTLRGSDSLSKLRQYAEDVIRPALEQVDGVAAVDVRGGAKREVNVELDRAKIDALGLSPGAIVARLKSENLSVPAGHFDEGDREISVRTLAEFVSVDQVRETIVATATDGSAVRLRDVASVTDGYAELRTKVRVNGEEAVTLEIRKQSGQNTVAIANAAKAKMTALEQAFPAGMTASLIIDQARFIEGQVKQVEEDIVFGGLMAVLIILVFMLDLRSTLISAVALPTSVIGTFYVMYALGYSLNMMTLLALSLAIGLLIDDAVVVRENIFKHLEAGKPPRQAALDGTKEVALSVLATTLTIVAVFMPIAFVDGIVGQFFRQFGITISAAVVISLFVAFTLDPMLSSRFAKSVDQKGDLFRYVKMPIEWVHSQMEQTYRAMLHWAVRHKLVVGSLAVGSIFLMGYIAKLTGQEFVNSEDRGQFVVEAELPAGTSLAETAKLTESVEAELLKNPDFKVVFATIGDSDQVNKVKWRIVTTTKTDRTATIQDLKQMARKTMESLKDARISVTDPPFVEGASTEAPIMINVRGQEYPDIERAADEIEAILKATPGVGDIQVRYSPGRPELTFELDRAKAAERGLSAAEVAMSLRTAVEGDEAGKLKQPGQREDVPIKVRLDKDYRADATALANLSLPSRHGPVRLGDVVNIKRSEGPQVIERENRNRQITIWAAPIGRPLGDVANEFQPQIAKLALAEGMSIIYDGQLRMMNETNENMGLALLLGVVFIYIVLASQFESFVHPLTIMMTLPLALVGAIMGLFLNNNTLAMGALIGIILLMGLVTKNAILLVDRAIVRVREHGETPLQAILEAGPERLRPILMTSAAMVLGMLPTATGNSEGSEFRAPMAVAVIGGVISSTLLSLIVVPVFYLVVENVKGWLSRMRLRFGRRPTNVGVASSAALIAVLVLGLSSKAFAQPGVAPAVNPGVAPSAPVPTASQTAPRQAAVVPPVASTATVQSAELPSKGAVSLELQKKLEQMKSGQGLTSKEVARLAVVNSKQVLAKHQALLATDSTVDKAHAGYLPKLTVTARYTRLSPINMPQLSLFGDQALVFSQQNAGPGDVQLDDLVAAQIPGFAFPVFLNQYALTGVLDIPLSDYVLRVSNAVDAAKHNRGAAALNERAVQLSVARDARVAYYEWIRAQGAELVAAQALEQAKGHERDAQNAFNAGITSRADVLRATSQVKNSELFHHRAQSAVQLITKRLKIMMGDAAPATFNVGEDILVIPAVMAVEEDAAVNEALAKRLELQALETSMQALSSQGKLAGAAYYPRLDAQGRVNYSNPNERYLPGDGKFHATWDVSVMLSWSPTDIFSTDAASAELRSQAQVLSAQRQELSEALRLEVSTALASVENARFAVGAVQEQLVSSEEGFRTRGELYRAGRATSVELIDAETELTRTRLELVNAYVDLHIAQTQLDHALGRDQAPGN